MFIDMAYICDDWCVEKLRTVVSFGFQLYGGDCTQVSVSRNLVYFVPYEALWLFLRCLTTSVRILCESACVVQATK